MDEGPLVPWEAVSFAFPQAHHGAVGIAADDRVGREFAQFRQGR